MNKLAPTELDTIGLNCPLPVLKARQMLKRLRPGDTLIIRATDPLSAVDIPHLCQEDRHTLVSTQLNEGVYRFELIKGEIN